MLKATHFMYYLLVVHIFCSIFATYLTKLLRKGIYLLCKKQIIYDKTYNIKYRKDPKEVVKYCRSGKISWLQRKVFEKSSLDGTASLLQNRRTRSL